MKEPQPRNLGQYLALRYRAPSVLIEEGGQGFVYRLERYNAAPFVIKAHRIHDRVTRFPGWPSLETVEVDYENRILDIHADHSTKVELSLKSACNLQRAVAEARILELLGGSFTPKLKGEYFVGGLGQLYHVTELSYASGETLKHYLDEKMTEEEKAALSSQLCRAVQHLHKKKIVHGDLKPANVFYDQGWDSLTLIDFGSAHCEDGFSSLPVHSDFEAKLFDERYLEGAFIFPTEGYASPELKNFTDKVPQPEDDVFSLGVLLYELFVGDYPFEVEELEDYDRQIHERIIGNLIQSIQSEEVVIALAGALSPLPKVRNLEALAEAFGKISRAKTFEYALIQQASWPS